jgi:hypothetical protein
MRGHLIVFRWHLVAPILNEDWSPLESCGYAEIECSRMKWKRYQRCTIILDVSCIRLKTRLHAERSQWNLWNDIAKVQLVNLVENVFRSKRSVCELFHAIFIHHLHHPYYYLMNSLRKLACIILLDLMTRLC